MLAVFLSYYGSMISCMFYETTVPEKAPESVLLCLDHSLGATVAEEKDEKQGGINITQGCRDM